MDMTTFKHSGGLTNKFTSFNIHREHIWNEVLHMHETSLPQNQKPKVMGPNPKGGANTTRLRVITLTTSTSSRGDIECLIQEGILKKNML